MPPNRRYTASNRRYAAFSTFIVFVQLCKLIMRNRQRQVRLLFSVPRSNSDDKLAFYLSTLRGTKRRKAWAYARSTEWIRLLITSSRQNPWMCGTRNDWGRHSMQSSREYRYGNSL